MAGITLSMAATSTAPGVAARLHERLDAARPLVVGGLGMLVALNLTADTSSIHGSIHMLEHAVLAFLAAEFALHVAVSDSLPTERWLEAGVLVPYVTVTALLFGARAVGCGVGPLSVVVGPLDTAHQCTALGRELVALDVVAGLGVATFLKERLDAVAARLDSPL